MPNHKKWFDEKLAIVKKKAGEGLPARAIYELKLPQLAGFTERAIQNTMSRHRYTDPIRSTRRCKATRLSKRRKARLIKYLNGNGCKESNKLVANTLGISVASVEWFRKKLGQKVDRIAIFRSDAYRAATSQRVIQFGIEMREGRRMLMHIRCRRLEAEGCRAPRKRCLVCGELWYALPFFYYLTTYQTKEGKRKTFFGTCKPCYNDTRATARPKYHEVA